MSPGCLDDTVGCPWGACLTTPHAPLLLRVLGLPCSVPPGCSPNLAGCPHAPQGARLTTLHTPGLPGVLCSTSTPRALGSPGRVSRGARLAGHPQMRFEALEAGVSPALPGTRLCEGRTCGQGRLPRAISEGLGDPWLSPGQQDSRSFWPKPTLVFLGCFGAESLPGAGDRGHETLSSPRPVTPKRPLGELAASVLGAAGHPRGQREKSAIKEWVSAPRETRGKECTSACEESALGFPWHGVRATVALLPSFPLASSWAQPSPPSQLRAEGKMLSSRQGKELVQLLA